MTDGHKGSGREGGAAPATGASPAPKESEAALPDWKSNLDSYREKSVLTFASEEDLAAAIDLLWTDALVTLPHDTPDGHALVIPTEALPYFTRAGIKFTAKRLRSMRELTAEDISKLRR